MGIRPITQGMTPTNANAPQQFAYDFTQTINITAAQVDQRIAQLTAELAKWAAIKDEINALSTPKGVNEATVTP